MLTLVKLVIRSTKQNLGEHITKGTQNQKSKSYLIDMSQNGWEKFIQVMPIFKLASKRGGRPAVAVKEVIKAICMY